VKTKLYVPAKDEGFDYAIEFPSKGMFRNNRIEINLKHKRRREELDEIRDKKEERWQ
jgi:hypothetical protein